MKKQDRMDALEKQVQRFSSDPESQVNYLIGALTAATERIDSARDALGFGYELAALRAEVERLREVQGRLLTGLRWALGESPDGTPEFPVSEPPTRYAWRTILRDLTGLRYDGKKSVLPAREALSE